MAKFVGTPLRGIEFGAPGDEAISVKVAGDTVARLRIDAGGRLTWSDGESTGDVLLYRDAAGYLLTDDIFEATGGLVTLVTDGEPTENLPDGALAVDATNSLFYFRADGAWYPLVPNLALDDLTDVTVFNPQAGQFLQYDGSEWRNSTLPTNEPTGFTVKSDSEILFDESTRVFTIQPSDSKFDVWCSGILYSINSAQTVTIPDTSGLYYIYFDSAGTLQYKTTYFEFSLEAPVSYIYWNAEDDKAYFFADERHGITLDWATHEYLHRTRGAAIAGGFGAGAYTITGDGSLDAHAQIDIANGTFFDEDLEIQITHSASPTANTWEQRLQGGAYIPIFRHEGNHWVKDVATQFPMKQGTSRAQYNLNTGGVWSSVDLVDNKFGISWIVATNNLNEPIIAILGQDSYNTQGAADEVGWDQLDLTGFPVFEFRPLYKITYKTLSGYANTPHARLTGVYDLRRVISGADHAIPTTPITDHGSMIGLADDDHPQYLLADGTRSAQSLTVNGNINFEGSTVDGFETTLFATDPTQDNTITLPNASGTVALEGQIELGTDTTGNYVSDITAGTGVTVTHTPGEGSSPSIAIGQDVSTTANVQFADLTVSGNLTVQGNTTTLNTETLSVEDNIITLNSNVTGSPTVDAGIEVERGTSPNVQIRYNETTDRWQFTNDGTNYTDLGGVKLSATEPLGVNGELWFNTDTQALYVYDGEWIAISGGGGGGASVLVQDTAPGFGSTGDLWYSSSLGKFFIRYDSFWVEIMSAGPQGPEGPAGPTGPAGPQGPAGENADITTSSIDDLSDVVITTPVLNNYLRWNGTTWVNHPIELGTHTQGDYVDSLVAGTGVTILNNTGAGATPTVRIGQAVGTTSSPTFANITATGNINAVNATFSGNLTVQGNAVILNTEEVRIEDNFIVLNSSATGAPTVNAGFEVERGDLDNVAIRWNETTNKWQFTNDSVNYIDFGAAGAIVSDSAPSNPETGQIWFNSATAKTYVFYDSFWIEVGGIGGGGTGGGGASVTVSDTAPESPTDGDLWFDSLTTKTFVYFNSFWVEIGSTGTGATVSSTAPSSPVTGQIWFDSSVSKTYVFVDPSWVEITNWGVVNAKGDIIVGSADNTVTALTVGSDGQVLVANSATATGLEWETPNFVSPTTVDAKGDILIGTADNTVSKVAVGTNGQILVANSATTSGVQWQTPTYASTGKAIAMAIVFSG